jgi:surface antigen
MLQGCIMVRSRALLALLCLWLSLGLSLFPATLQAALNTARNSRTGLNDVDVRAMSATAARLYKQDTVANGAKDHWSNPRSGNSGSITVLESFTKSDMPCRRLRYDIHLHARRTTRSFTVNWCKTATGAWKLS